MKHWLSTDESYGSEQGACKGRWHPRDHSMQDMVHSLGEGRTSRKESRMDTALSTGVSVSTTFLGSSLNSRASLSCAAMCWCCASNRSCTSMWRFQSQSQHNLTLRFCGTFTAVCLWNVVIQLTHSGVLVNRSHASMAQEAVSSVTCPLQQDVGML